MTTLERHPTGFIFAFRFIYGIRTVSPIAIGMSAISARTYVLVNAAAAAVWGVLFTSIGYAFSHAIEQVFGRLRSEQHLLIGTAAIILIMLAAVVLLRTRRLSQHQADREPRAPVR